MKINAEVLIKGIRTHNTTEERKKVELLITIEEYESGPAIILHNGVTGYESFCLKSASNVTKNGWWACAGTKGRWDSLFIPAKEMTKAFKELEIQK